MSALQESSLTKPIGQAALGAALAAAADRIEQIPLANITPSPFNPRKTFEGIDELAASIAEQGLLENLVVRPAKKDGHFELIAGERRFRALKQLKRETAPCKVLAANDGQARAAQIVENLQRADVGAMEEAKGFAALQDEDHKTWTPQVIAKAVGKTDRFVQQRIQMARNLSPKAQKAMSDGDLKIEVARTLAIAPKTVQDKLLDELDDWDFDRMTADEMREHILEEMVPVEIAAFDLAVYKGGFHDEGKKRFFTDVEQFNHLQKVAANSLAASLRPQWPKAAVIESHQTHHYCWGDTGQHVYGSDSKKKATSALKVAREKLTAIVWIDQGRVKSAEAVGPSALFHNASSGGGSAGYSGGMPARESAEQRRYRQAYNAAVFEAVAAKPDFALRVLLARFIDGTTRFTYDHNEAKKGHEAILPKDLLTYVNTSRHDKTVQLWAAVKKLKADDVAAMVAKYTARSLSWQSGYMGGKKPPEFTALLAEETKAKLPVKTAAKAKPKPAAKKKAATKRKHA